MAKSYGGIRGRIYSQNSIPSIDTSAPISQQIQELINVALSSSPNRTMSIVIASVESRIKDFADKNSIDLAGNKIILTREAIGHTFRDRKHDAGIAIAHKELITFPTRMKSMSLYYDNDKNNFIYFDGKAKYIIEPNKTKGKGKRKTPGVYYVTASRADADHFRGRRYIEIK